MSPLQLDSGGLGAARAALAPPARRATPAWFALGCAVLMTGAALAACAIVILGGWTPPDAQAAYAPVRAVLGRR